MSIPKNHHYITQGHIKNFFNYDEKAIYLYDKNSQRLFSKNSTKSIFSERNLNTKRNADGSYNYSSIEEELNRYFEKDFPMWSRVVHDFVASKTSDQDTARYALHYLARYGVIAESRTPHNKKVIDDAIYNGLTKIFNAETENLPEELARAFEFNDEVKYTNTGSNLEFANEALNEMGDLYFSIEIPKDQDDHFILPDFGAKILRERINNHFNFDAKDIAYIGLPLSSNVYIHFFSGKLNKFPVMPGIHYRSSEEVAFLNRANYNYATQFIACKDQHYLKRFTAEL